MTDWLLQHRDFLSAIIVINGASIAVLIFGLVFTPKVTE